MDKRRKYLIGLDTETLNGLIDSLVYDLGWAITDKVGNIYRVRSFIIYETFFGMKDVMTSAYYANKIPMYLEEIKAGKRQVVTLATARKILLQDMKEFGIDTVFRHNARFDYKALNNTMRYLTKSQYRYFFPKYVTIWDTLKMSKVITNQKSYRRYCEDNGFMTNHKTPRPRATAEILFRYISGNIDFEENHTGLEDVLIETKIMAHCFRQHKKMTKELWAK